MQCVVVFLLDDRRHHNMVVSAFEAASSGPSLYHPGRTWPMCRALVLTGLFGARFTSMLTQCAEEMDADV